MARRHGGDEAMSAKRNEVSSMTKIRTVGMVVASPLLALTRAAISAMNAIDQRAAIEYLAHGNAARRVAFGLVSEGPIEGGQEGVIRVVIQEGVRPLELWVSPRVGRDFMIDDVKVGKSSQLITGSPIPAGRFVEGHPFEMDTIQREQVFSIQVTNVSGAACRFECTVSGLAL